MAATKTIPLGAVRLACVTAKARHHGIAVDRFAAFSDCPLVGIDCDDALRGLKPYRVPACHFLPMSRGNMAQVLERVRRAHGLAEVRRTWGAGLRFLQAEFAATTVIG